MAWQLVHFGLLNFKMVGYYAHVCVPGS